MLISCQTRTIHSLTQCCMYLFSRFRSHEKKTWNIYNDGWRTSDANVILKAIWPGDLKKNLQLNNKTLKKLGLWEYNASLFQLSYFMGVCSILCRKIRKHTCGENHRAYILSITSKNILSILCNFVKRNGKQAKIFLTIK